MGETVSHDYRSFGPEELGQFDRDFSDISKMYSTQEKDNLIQLWTGTEILAAKIQEAIMEFQKGENANLSADQQYAIQSDKGVTLLHLGFYKNTQGGAPYMGRAPPGKGIGMDVIRPEDAYGAASTFTLWDQPTAGWTAMPAALFEIRAWCSIGNPDASLLTLAAIEIMTIDANDDHWALMIFGLMELTASVDVYAFHMRTNGQPRGPYVLENQIRVGDVQYARFGPLYIEKTTPFAFGLEFRGNVGDVPITAPKLWGLCFYSQRRALTAAYANAPRTRCRLA